TKSEIHYEPTQISKLEEDQEPKKIIPKSEDTIEPTTSVDIAEEERKELEETESELDIQEKEFICLVHKGPVAGSNIYLCPKCKTIYCTKCVTALKENSENCWVCDREFDL
ncbi:MAG: hypothetical protein ACFFBV_15990, partial [Promethearchaeota archaeon]